jgi:hypothetical protein
MPSLRVLGFSFRNFYDLFVVYLFVGLPSLLKSRDKSCQVELRASLWDTVYLPLTGSVS